MIISIDPNNPEQFNKNDFSQIDNFVWGENPDIKISMCYPKTNRFKEIMVLVSGPQGTLLIPFNDFNLAI